MTDSGYAIFDTAIGRCGISWSLRGLAAVQLPETSDAEIRGRVTRRVPFAMEAPPPPALASAIAAIVALLAGDASVASAFDALQLDLRGIAEFDRGVYDVARTVPPGQTVTYGEIARRLGDPAASRAVGQALGKNPFPLVVPCHRVLAASGQLGGFSASGGRALKRRLLQIEGARGLPVAGLFDEL